MLADRLHEGLCFPRPKKASDLGTRRNSLIARIRFVLSHPFRDKTAKWMGHPAVPGWSNIAFISQCEAGILFDTACGVDTYSAVPRH
jgi:hypothetical protein